MSFNFKRALGGLSGTPKTNPAASTILGTPQALKPIMAPAGTTPLSRSVAKTVYAEEVEEGVGARVRRSVGSPRLKNLSPFLMLDHFHVSKGAGFDDHPHRGQCTVTYMLEGSSRHEDSAGHKGTIVRGGVQWMCAGRGILHAEMPVEEPGKPEPRGLQLWVDIPKNYKMVEPSYQELGPEEIPSAFPQGPDGPIEIKVISGDVFGVKSPVRSLGGCWYFHVVFKEESTVFIDLPLKWTAFMYINKGSIRTGASSAETASDEFHTLVLSADEKETGVSVTATKAGSEIILCAGEPLDQPVVQYGPFVMTSADEIRQTIMDYQTGTNGFESAKNWVSSIGLRAQGKR